MMSAPSAAVDADAEGIVTVMEALADATERSLHRRRSTRSVSRRPT